MLTDQLERIRYGGDEAFVKRLSIRGLMPDTDHYMTYDGSTTAPACHETVTWVVLNKPIYITKQQVSDGFCPLAARAISKRPILSRFILNSFSILNLYIHKRPIPNRPILSRPILNRLILNRPILNRPIPNRPILKRPILS